MVYDGCHLESNPDDCVDMRASSSNYGTIVDIFAPGTWIDSAGIANDNAVLNLSGTSMACPFVAGKYPDVNRDYI